MFRDRIWQNYTSLTPGFRRLADYILNNTLDTAFLTPTELAHRVAVDPITIDRFAQKLGYRDYQQLSQEVKQYVRDKISSVTRDAGASQTEEEILHEIADNIHRNLRRYFSTDTPHLAEAVRALRKATHIWIAGEYTSYDLAQMLAKGLSLINIPATAFRPNMTESASILPNMQSGHAMVALTIGQPGIDTGYALKLARQKGLTTISITTFKADLATREADIAIKAPALSTSGLVSFAVALMLIAVIWEALANAQAEKTGIAFLETQEAMGILLSMRANTPDDVIKVT